MTPSAISAFTVRDYDLEATLTSGQAFRWLPHDHGWIGVIGNRWVRLEARCSKLPTPDSSRLSSSKTTGKSRTRTRTRTPERAPHPTASSLQPGESILLAHTALPVSDWAWLTHYLQLDLDLNRVLRTFPNDPPMQAAVAACRGLRLLRQDPWECLASFVLSSTKQIVQIRQIVALLCERYGEPIPTPLGYAPAWAFPSPARLAQATEAELRACKMGFRAPYLLAAARRVAGGRLDLARLGRLPLADARSQLMHLPGVGRKIADCVLLFACGFPSVFPVDVWIMKALRELYFPRRHVKLEQLHRFAAAHFGPCAGYAQQYLFHYMRTKLPEGKEPSPKVLGSALPHPPTLVPPPPYDP